MAKGPAPMQMVVLGKGLAAYIWKVSEKTDATIRPTAAEFRPGSILRSNIKINS